MGAIQVKHVPEELHAALRERAAAEGVSLQDYVLGVLRRDLVLPSQRDWLDDLRRQPVTPNLPLAADVLADARRERTHDADRD